MRVVAEARAVPGRGLEGDRYFEGRGTFSGSPDTELTLVFPRLEDEGGEESSPQVVGLAEARGLSR